ncbi:hypothetical protein [Fictibacillus macauensis]|uniref:hypothetical protein n=1 Tax=Fictibacillus macauensis TaxID=245160 RepID=UPI0012EAE604|nr:hypothetical protein [Fictibacillus macauensis]
MKLSGKKTLAGRVSGERYTYVIATNEETNETVSVSTEAYWLQDRGIPSEGYFSVLF